MPSNDRRIDARHPKDLDRAWRRYYSRLAAHFRAEIGQRRLRVVLEAGCGKGQLTIPLMKLLPSKAHMIGVDSSRGPYDGWLRDLTEILKEERLEERVRTIRTDVRKMREVPDESVDLVVSNELLCDLPYDKGLEVALREFRRVLRPGGLMIHGEWSSFSTVEPQAFLVKHWPSWSPDQLFPLMRKHGFRDFRVTYFDTTIHFGYENAVRELLSWGADSRFLRRYERLLKSEGLDLPFEHIVKCRK